MKPIYDEVNYVFNERDEIDVNYYINEAHKLRSEALRTYGLKVVKSIKAGIGYIFSLPHNPKTA